MGIAFNPLSGQFDLTGSSAAITWRGAVSTEAGLSTSGNTDGDAVVTLDTDYVWVWDGTTSRWINQGVKSAVAGSTPNTAGYSLGYSNIASNRREYQLTLQPADATNPGIVSTGTQSIAGVKTFGSRINADGGLDSTGASLAIGATTASTITIGRSGTTINMVGSTTYEQVTNLQVADKLITINKGGGSTTATGTGFEVEENSAITGYVKTSSDRNSWQLLAPNTAGVVTVTPGSSGFTIDQASHNPVTLGAFGSTPNSAGLTLSTQAINLEPADATNPGAITAGTQTLGGAKTFSSALTASTSVTSPIFSSNTSNAADAGIVRLAKTDLIEWRNNSNNGNNTISMASDLFLFSRSVCPLNDNSVNSGGAANRWANVASMNYILYGSSSGNLTLTPSASTTSHTLTLPSAQGLVNSALMNDGAGALSWTVIKSTGDIKETSFTAADNQGSAANVTGLAFANATVRSFEAIVSIVRGSTYAQYKLYGLQEASAWELVQDKVGDVTGLVFTITTAGQVQYTSTSTGSTAAVRFRAITTSV